MIVIVVVGGEGIVVVRGEGGMVVIRGVFVLEE
jgi:hypothetical protein